MTAAPATASRGAAFRAVESPQRHDEEVALDDDASSTSSSVEALEYVRISARFDAEDAERDDEASRGADAGKDAAVAPRCPSVARASPSSRDGDDVSDGAALPDAASPPPPRTYKVRIQDMRFHPAALEIPRGAIVEWEPDRSCDVRHCLEVVDEDEEPQALSPALVPGAPWRHRFEDVGDFHYRSLVYCFMKGSVVVVDPPTPDPPVLMTTTSRSEDSVSKTAPPPRANESPADSDEDSDADSAVASASVPYVALRSEDDRSDEDEDEPREAREASSRDVAASSRRRRRKRMRDPESERPRPSDPAAVAGDLRAHGGPDVAVAVAVGRLAALRRVSVRRHFLSDTRPTIVGVRQVRRGVFLLDEPREAQGDAPPGREGFELVRSEVSRETAARDQGGDRGGVGPVGRRSTPRRAGRGEARGGGGARVGEHETVRRIRGRLRRRAAFVEGRLRARGRRRFERGR